jgi:RNA-directed DNA polymerase
MSREVHVRFCESRGVRFPPATHLVVMVAGERHHAEALREQVTAALAPLGLRLAPEKTRVVHIDEGFDFLGFTIRRLRKRGTSKYYIYTWPSAKSVQAVRDKVKARTHRSTRYLPPEALITSLNRLLAGWAGYFRHGVSKKIFASVDSYTWTRTMRWLRGKYKGKKNRPWAKDIQRRFCLPGTWRLACNGTVLTGASSVPVTRYRYRGTKIPAPWNPQPAAAING